MPVFRNFGYNASHPHSSIMASHMSNTIYEKHEKVIYRVEAAEDFKDQCLNLYKAIYIDHTFWLLVAVDSFSFYYPISSMFDSECYTLIELFQIIGYLNKVQIPDKAERLVIECSAKAILDILTSLQPILASTECLKFLLEDAGIFTPIMRTHYAPF